MFSYYFGKMYNFAISKRRKQTFKIWTSSPNAFSKQIKRQLQFIEIGWDDFSEMVRKLSFNGK